MEITINGEIIFYEEKGQGTPLLCIHGFDVDHRLMAGFIEPLFSETSNYRRIYLDLPGMGLSPANPIIKSADEMLTTIEMFISEVIGNENYLLVGQSYGGYLSLGLAYKQPESILGIFLLCPCIIADSKARILPVNNCHKNVSFDISIDDLEAFNDYSRLAARVTNESWERYKKEVWSGLQTGDKTFTKNYQESGYAFSYESELKNLIIEQPVHVLTGKQDDIVGYEDAFELVKNFTQASFSVIDQAGHNLQLDQPKRVENDFRDWLQRVNQ